MKHFQGRTAVITGAGSGFGLEFARLAAGLGMHVAMADVQADALDAAVAEVGALAASHGGRVIGCRTDVSSAADMQALRDATLDAFGVPHLLFNNAGVGAGGLIWEHSEKDWAWVVGVNLMGVAHGVRLFVPAMVDAAAKDPGYEAHVINTASMAGLLNAPNMGVYNVTKHAVVSLSETLHHDLSLVTEQVRASVLCPYFVPTGIHLSHRNRPGEMRDAGVKPTRSQLIAQAMSDKAVTSGKVSAADVAAIVFDAIRDERFYIYSHPKALAAVQVRLEDVMLGRNPSDPFAHKPEIGADLRRALRAQG